MADVTSEAIPGVGIGIIHPQLEHRWRAIVHAKDDRFIHFTANIVSNKIDYLKKEIKVEVQENILGHVSDVIYDLCDRPFFTYDIEALDGHDVINFSNRFIRTRVVEHNLSYDYAISGVITHRMTFKFDNLQILIRPEKEEPAQ